MSAIMDLVMLLFLRARHWQLVLLSAALIGIPIYFWFYSVCRFAAIETRRFGSLKAISVSNAALLAAYSVSIAWMDAPIRFHILIITMFLVGSVGAAQGVARLQDVHGEAASFWTAWVCCLAFPIGIWRVQPILNHAARPLQITFPGDRGRTGREEP